MGSHLAEHPSVPIGSVVLTPFGPGQWRMEGVLALAEF
jgi:hypothetical protein